MKKNLLFLTILGLLCSEAVSAQFASDINESNTSGKRINYNRAIPKIPARLNNSFTPVSDQTGLKTTVSEGVWSSNGPYGGLVFSFAIDTANNIIYAGTRNGVWKSNNGGESWEYSLSPETGYITWGWNMVNSISILKDNPDIVYSICATGLYKSTDRGLSWNQVLTPGVWGNVQAFTYNAHEIVYVSEYGTGIEKSNDGGLSWENITPYNLSPSGPIIVNEDNPDIILAGANGSGIFKTVTGDTNWIQLNNGIPTDLTVVALKENPKNNNTLYACLSKIFPEQVGIQGLYKSYNAGESWQLINQAINFRNSLYEFDMMAVNPADTNMVLIVCNDSLYKSTDGGVTFKYSSSALISGCITVNFDPVNIEVIYLGKYNGISKSNDGGNTWIESSNGMLGTTPTKVAINKNNQNILYVVSNGLNGLDKSIDGGLTWQNSNTGLPGYAYNSVTLDPINQETLYSVTPFDGIYKSTDSGNLWGQLTDQLIYTFEIDHSNSNNQYGSIDNVFYKSYDGGATWNEISTITTGGFFDGAIVSIAKDPNYQDVFYCGTQPFWSTDMFGGLFKSTDGGITWTQLVTDQAPVRIAIDPNNSDIVYYGTCENGLFKSADGGLSWNSLTTGLGTGESLPYISDIVINSENSNILYVGLQNNFYNSSYAVNNGIYKSTDAGLTWEALPMDGLLWKDVEGLSLSPDNSKLYASIQCGGVFSYDISAGIVKQPIKVIYLQNVPNPFHSSTTLCYNLPENETVKLEIFNVNGQKIRSLIDHYQIKGKHEIEWDGETDEGATANTGIFIARLKTIKSVYYYKILHIN
ncbi:MAG: hypothetical protein M0P58_10575 [Bacteroidales bacterium]|nr:hypothetical protein [Bacteroidales bacterium]